MLQSGESRSFFRIISCWGWSCMTVWSRVKLVTGGRWLNIIMPAPKLESMLPLERRNSFPSLSWMMLMVNAGGQENYGVEISGILWGKQWQQLMFITVIMLRNDTFYSNIITHNLSEGTQTNNSQRTIDISQLSLVFRNQCHGLWSHHQALSGIKLTVCGSTKGYSLEYMEKRWRNRALNSLRLITVCMVDVLGPKRSRWLQFQTQQTRIEVVR